VITHQVKEGICPGKTVGRVQGIAIAQSFLLGNEFHIMHMFPDGLGVGPFVTRLYHHAYLVDPCSQRFFHK